MSRRGRTERGREERRREEAGRMCGEKQPAEPGQSNQRGERDARHLPGRGESKRGKIGGTTIG